MLIIICFPVIAYSSLAETAILGDWIIIENVTPRSYITGPPEEGKLLLNAHLSFKKDVMSLASKIFKNISYDVKTYTADDVFKGWHIRLKELGISERSVVIIEVIPKEENAYIEISQFIRKSDDVFIAITENGLFEMRRMQRVK